MNPALSILIVDDEPAILSLLEQLLAAEGFEVVTASSGDEAIQLSREIDFDLFLVDLIMPGKDGIETMLALRTRCQHTPVIVMSGGESGPAHNYLPLAVKLGASGTLAKPFDRKTLLEAIGRAAAKPRVMAG